MLPNTPGRPAGHSRPRVRHALPRPGTYGARPPCGAGCPAKAFRAADPGLPALSWEPGPDRGAPARCSDTLVRRSAWSPHAQPAQHHGCLDRRQPARRARRRSRVLLVDAGRGRVIGLSDLAWVAAQSRPARGAPPTGFSSTASAQAETASRTRPTASAEGGLAGRVRVCSLGVTALAAMAVTPRRSPPGGADTVVFWDSARRERRLLALAGPGHQRTWPARSCCGSQTDLTSSAGSLALRRYAATGARRPAGGRCSSPRAGVRSWLRLDTGDDEDDAVQTATWPSSRPAATRRAGYGRGWRPTAHDRHRPRAGARPRLGATGRALAVAARSTVFG
jgi:hypothetical protein